MHFETKTQVGSNDVRVGGSLAPLVISLRAWLGDSGMMAYLVMMGARLVELRRVLKETGSIYLHCDPTASHYIKLIMDAIFGHKNFRNEVIWKRTGAHGNTMKWGPVHDVLLFYTVSDFYTWNRVFQPYEPGYLASKYRKSDKRGFFQDVSLTGPGTTKGDSGASWRSHNPTTMGRHWAIPGAIGEGIKNCANLTTQQQLDELDKADLIHWPKPL